MWTEMGWSRRRGWLHLGERSMFRRVVQRRVIVGGGPCTGEAVLELAL